MPQMVIEVSEEEHDTLQEDAEMYGFPTPDELVQALVSGWLREWPVVSQEKRDEMHRTIQSWLGTQ